MYTHLIQANFHVNFFSIIGLCIKFLFLYSPLNHLPSMFSLLLQDHSMHFNCNTIFLSIT